MKTLHLLSHTHWDREWYLTFQQFRLKLVHLIDGLLDLLESDPDFKYFMLDGQTIVLDDYLHMRPENEALLRQHVQAGRILIGPWHILPDMFLVSPEAHIRNLLQGERTARKFGPKMMVGYIPDPFGHPGQIPQILRGFGIETAALWRGVGDQPAEFWWQAPDGSRVMLAFLRDSYSNGANLAAHDPGQFCQQLEQARNSLAAHSIADDLLILFGTDHMEPPPQTSAAIAYANAHMENTRVVHSTFPAYLAAIRPSLEKSSLPVVVGELRACSRSPLLPGVLSTRMWIKQRNRACETLLEKWAEPFSTFASLVIDRLPGQSNPQPSPLHLLVPSRLRNPAGIVRQAWRLLMENHPHDSICGCSIDQVHAEMKTRFDQVEQIGEEITRQSLATLAEQIDTRNQAAYTAIVVFNASTVPQSGLVEVEINLPPSIENFEIVDNDGRILAHQASGSEPRELINMILDRAGLQDGLAVVHEGWIAGMAVQAIRFERRENQATIHMLLSEHSAPNQQAWETGLAAGQALLADPAIESFHVLAHSMPASRVAFVAGPVPAHGWQTYWARPVSDPSPGQAPRRLPVLLQPLIPLAIRMSRSRLGESILTRLNASPESRPPFCIENEFFSVEADSVDGTLTVTDKRNGAIYRGLHRFVDGGDAGDEYNYSPPARDTVIAAQAATLRVIRQKAAARLEISYHLEIPAGLAPDRASRSAQKVQIPITSRIHLAAGIPRIEIQSTIDNLGEDHRLRVHFPAPSSADWADYDGHFEVVRRALDLPHAEHDWTEAPRPEAPQRAFVDVSDGRAGLMIANRGLPEVEVLRNAEGCTEIALTVLRCVGWLSRDDLATRKGHAGPGKATPGAQMIGPWRFDYAIIPHAGNWPQALEQAYVFETPLRAIATGTTAGELPGTGAVLSHAPDKFVISAIKSCETGQGWLVRGYNITGEAIQVRLRPATRFGRAERVNLAETCLGEIEIAGDGSIAFPVAGHEIVSVVFYP